MQNEVRFAGIRPAVVSPRLPARPCKPQAKTSDRLAVFGVGECIDDFTAPALALATKPNRGVGVVPEDEVAHLNDISAHVIWSHGCAVGTRDCSGDKRLGSRKPCLRAENDHKGIGIGFGFGRSRLNQATLTLSHSTRLTIVISRGGGTSCTLTHGGGTTRTPGGMECGQ